MMILAAVLRIDYGKEKGRNRSDTEEALTFPSKHDNGLDQTGVLSTRIPVMG